MDKSYQDTVLKNSDHSGKSLSPVNSISELPRRTENFSLLTCRVILNRLTEKESTQFQIERPSKRTRLDTDALSLPAKKDGQIINDESLCCQTEELDYDFDIDNSIQTSEKDYGLKTSEKADKKTTSRKRKTMKDEDKKKKYYSKKKSFKETDSGEAHKKKSQEESFSKSDSKKNANKSSAFSLSNFRIPRKAPSKLDVEKLEQMIDSVPPTIGLPAFLQVEHNNNSQATSQPLKNPTETHKSILNMSFKKSEQDKSVTFNNHITIRKLSPISTYPHAPTSWAPVTMNIEEIIDELSYTPPALNSDDLINTYQTQLPVKPSNHPRFSINTCLCISLFGILSDSCIFFSD